MFYDGLDALPDHCIPTNSFLVGLSSIFHICIPTPLAFISTVLGTLSIVSWLFAQVPQIIKNHSIKSTSGLSLWFLLEWAAGDTTNLLGAILTRQAGWQVIVAGYYVSVDVVLVWQWMWYTHYQPWREAGRKMLCLQISRDDRDEDRGQGQIISGLSPVKNHPESRSTEDTKSQADEYKNFAKPIPTRVSKIPDLTCSSTPREKATRPSSHHAPIRTHSPSFPPHSSPKTLLFISTLCAILANASPLTTTLPTTATPTPQLSTRNNAEVAGRILSWTSTLLYLGSRLPQLYKNHTRRSTAGLSPSLFVAAFFGNLFYSTSLLTNPCAWADLPAYGGGGWAGRQGSDRREWLTLAAPFWLGAAGVLGLDATVGVQFWMYGEGREERVVRVKDERGRSRWRKVSGWMRGWVPSVSPARGVDGGEERRLLRDGGDGGGYGAA